MEQRVKDIMEKEAYTCHCDQTLSEVVQIFSAKGTSGLDVYKRHDGDCRRVLPLQGANAPRGPVAVQLGHLHVHQHHVVGSRRRLLEEAAGRKAVRRPIDAFITMVQRFTYVTHISQPNSPYIGYFCKGQHCQEGFACLLYTSCSR